MAGSEAPWVESHGVSYDTTRPYGLFWQRLLQIFGIEDNDSLESVREKTAIAPEGFPPEVQTHVVRAVAALLAFGSDADSPQLEGEALQREVYETCRSMWSAAASFAPTVMVMDDLHWADRASVELMIDMYSLVEEVPLLLLCSFRPERQSPAWQIKQTAETDYPHCYTEILLSALSDEDSDLLFGNLINNPDSPPRLRQMILEKTGGNPLFLEEFMRTLIDTGAITSDESGMRWRADTDAADIPIPENLLALLTSRIDRLEEDARRTLQMSSVIGRSFYHGVLKLLSDSSIALDRQLSTLQRAELIREARRVPELEYIFQHDLTREAAYNSILLRERREFHRRVGEAVEEMFNDRLEEQSHLLAHHFYQAGDNERAFRYCMMAGDEAARLYAHQEANSHYTVAIELIDRAAASREQRISLYVSRGRTLELIGEFDQALTNYQELQAFAQEKGDRTVELAALMPQATVRSTATVRFDVDKGRELSNHGLALARELNDHAAESKVLWNLMLLEYFEGRNRDQTITYGEQSLAIAREHNLEEQLAHTLNDISRAYFVVGKQEQAWAAQSESNDLLRKLGNLTMLTDSLITSAGGHYFLGQFQKALASAEECLEVSKSINSPWAQAVSLYVLGAIYLDLGETGKSIQALEEALPLAQEAGFNPPVTARLRLALYHGLVGNTDQGMELAQESMKNGESRQFALAAMAQVHLDRENPAAAAAAIKEAIEDCENGQSDPRAGYAIFQVIEGQTALANNDHQRALALAERTMSVLAEMGQRVILPDILRIKGEALLGLGDHAGGMASLEEALAESQSQGARRSLWAIQLAVGEAARAQGDQEKSRRLLAQAQETVDYIAEHSGSDRARENFLGLAAVKRVGTA